METEYFPCDTAMVERVAALAAEGFSFDASTIPTHGGAGRFPCVIAWHGDGRLIRLRPNEMAEGMACVKAREAFTMAEDMIERARPAPKSIPKRIAKQCVAYVGSQGLNGKARDKAAYHFFAASVLTLRAIGDNDNAAWIERVAVYLIAPRGFSEVERLVQE